MWPRCVAALMLVLLGTAPAEAAEAPAEAAEAPAEAAEALGEAAEGRAADHPQGRAALRVVSLNPSLTATLLALGAGDTLVGIDEYSARQQPDLRRLPRVGGLFNTSLESLVALEPDVVVLVPSAQQRDLRDRLGEVGIEVLALPNITLAELLASIEALGERVGREESARLRVAEIRREWKRVEETTRDGVRPRAVLVIQRDPLYVVGAGSYLAAMLEAAGAENAAAGFSEPYPRVSLEWLIAAAPQVILDSSDDPLPAGDFWGRWPSLPAVSSGRVVAVPAALVTLPGPHPERALRSLAEALRAQASP